jgi:predicted RNA-binding Zn ribbon-like protein
MPLTETDRGSGLAVAIDVVNTWDELAEPPELLRSVDVLRRVLAWHGRDEAAAAIGDGELAAARRLRDALGAVFDARSERAAVAALNELAAETGAPPQLERAGKAWRFRTWPPESEGLRFVAAYAAVGLLDAIRELGFARFGRCDGSPCRCVYVDRSRNRSRRYCCQLCADRVAQANLRRRRATRA